MLIFCEIRNYIIYYVDDFYCYLLFFQQDVLMRQTWASGCELLVPRSWAGGPGYRGNGTAPLRDGYRAYKKPRRIRRRHHSDSESSIDSEASDEDRHPKKKKHAREAGQTVPEAPCREKCSGEEGRNSVSGFLCLVRAI